MAKVFPTPGEAPRKTLSRPTLRPPSRPATWARSASGSGRLVSGILSKLILLRPPERERCNEEPGAIGGPAFRVRDDVCISCKPASLSPPLDPRGHGQVEPDRPPEGAEPLRLPGHKDD